MCRLFEKVLRMLLLLLYYICVQVLPSVCLHIPKSDGSNLLSVLL